MLLQQIDRWAELAPQHIAHRHRGQHLTYAELKTHSDALAVWLRQTVPHDPQQHIPIVIYGHKESEMLVLFLACLKAGHPYIPIDSSVPPERLLKILETSAATAILSPRSIPEKVKESGVFARGQIHLPDVYSFAPRSAEPEAEWQIALDDVWYIIFTSGSTGDPKGVQITQGALESFVNWVNREYRPRPAQEVFLNQAPFSFDLSVMDLYMALSNGGTLWSVDQDQIANAKDLFLSLREARLSYWVSTPSFAEMCLLDPGFTEKLLPRLRYFLFCGEVLPNDVASGLLRRFPQAQVINLYGPTECTVAVSGVNITAQMAGHSEPLPVGKNCTDCRIYICDPEELDRTVAAVNPATKSLPPGEKGEIVIAGPNVSIGYLNRPELTQHAFFSWTEEGISWRAYRTGDVGYWQEGQLFYQGRRDFQVKLHGYRIELGEIEEHLRRLPEVENAVVLPVVRRGKNAALQAFIKLSVKPESGVQESEHASTEIDPWELGELEHPGDPGDPGILREPDNPGSELVQLKLNIETSMTKVSSDDSLQWRLLPKAQPVMITVAPKDGFRRSRLSQKDTSRRRVESTPTEAEYGVPLPLVEVGVSRLDQRDIQEMGHRLRQKLGQVLPAYMLPQRYIFIQNMPLTANGKVDRKALLGGQYDPV